MSHIQPFREQPVAPTWRRSGRLRPLRASRGRTVVRLWLPLTPLFALLSPFALIAAPLLDLHPAGRRARPIRNLWALGTVLLSLSGTLIDIDTPRARVSIRIF
jgi:hypothetical protein